MKECKKGTALPINTVIAVALSMMILVAVAFFFSSRALGTISESDAQMIHATGCRQYCGTGSDPYSSNYKSCSEGKIDKSKAGDFDDKFRLACIKLGYITQQEAESGRCLPCMKRCGENVCILSPEYYEDNTANIQGTANAGKEITEA